jgi:hypothetical protein
VFLLRSENNRGPEPLNAISPAERTEEPEERRARHLRMCRQLTEISMELAHLAAARAGLAAAAAAGEPESTTRPPPGTTDPAMLFIRLSRSVQQSLALEARIAGDTAKASQTAIRQASRNTLRGDPRWNTIREIIKIATEKHPDRNEIRREAEARLQEELQADPEQSATTRATLQVIIDDVGIEVDYHQLPDELLLPLLPPGFANGPIDHLLPPDWQPVDHIRLRAKGPPE